MQDEAADEALLRLDGVWWSPRRRKPLDKIVYAVYTSFHCLFWISALWKACSVAQVTLNQCST